MPIDLAKLEALERAAFRAPWTYAEWEIECMTCASGGDCDNPECDGANVPCTTIESPEEYPDGQIVAQFTVPGLQMLADRNGDFIVALRNAFPELVAAVRERDRLRELIFEMRGCDLTDPDDELNRRAAAAIAGDPDDG